MTGARACDACLRRCDLVAALAGRIEIDWRQRRGRPQLLALPDEALLEWCGEASVVRRYAGFSPARARERIAAAGLEADCRCSDGYPRALRDLTDPPAVLHRTRARPVEAMDGAAAVVGARRASDYGREVARALGRGLAVAGLAVVSGMALGVDAAAHAGALEVDGVTVAVLAGGADVAYPPSKRALHARIVERGTVVSEMPPGFAPFRWSFPARNRIIAALAAGTVVVEGGERSGSLITADFAADLGRFVAAVPGPVTAGNAAGPNLLIKTGAELVRGASDVLELLHGVGAAAGEPAAPLAAAVGAGAGAGPRGGATADPPLCARRRELLDRVEAGLGSPAELATSAEDARRIAVELGELELLGLVRRTFGGRYVRAA